MFATRGGLYAGTSKDSQTTYVRDFLRFIGIESVHFVYAGGLGLGSERKEAALRDAHDTISQLTTAAAVAA